MHCLKINSFVQLIFQLRSRRKTCGFVAAGEGPLERPVDDVWAVPLGCSWPAGCAVAAGACGVTFGGWTLAGGAWPLVFAAAVRSISSPRPLASINVCMNTGRWHSVLKPDLVGWDVFVTIWFFADCGWIFEKKKNKMMVEYDWASVVANGISLPSGRVALTRIFDDGLILKRRVQIHGVDAVSSGTSLNPCSVRSTSAA